MAKYREPEYCHQCGKVLQPKHDNIPDFVGDTFRGYKPCDHKAESPAPQPKDTSGMQWAADFINNFKADKKLCYGLACLLQADLASLGIDISDNKRQQYQDKMAEDVVDEVLDYMLGKIESAPLLSTQQGERRFTLDDIRQAIRFGAGKANSFCGYPSELEKYLSDEEDEFF